MFNSSGPVIFTAGVSIGGLGGFVLGAFFGKYLLHLVSFLVGVVDRRGSSDEDRLKFELLLQ